MSTIANITWPFVPGSLATKVEYRVSGTTTWIQPTTPNNPTPGNTYPLTISDNIMYDVRLTTIASTCSPKSTTLQIINSINNCCPPGFTLSPDQTFCTQTNTVAATPPSSQETTIATPNVAYTNFGAFIYNSGYAADGTGASTQISVSNPFWINPTANTTAGPMNRSALWATTTVSNQDVGFSVCITVPATSTYYVGMGVDNYGILQIDGTTVITQDPAALASQYNSAFPGIGAAVTFKIWHIYPIVLTQGTHVLNIIGHNVGGAAGMGVEVYNLTPSQIQSATSYASMGSGLIFSSKDFVGQNVQIGSGGTGYTCPTGYSLVFCTATPFCTQTINTVIIPCSTTTTTTTSTTTSTTSTTSTTTTTTTTTSTTTSTTTTTTTTV